MSTLAIALRVRFALVWCALTLLFDPTSGQNALKRFLGRRDVHRRLGNESLAALLLQLEQLERVAELHPDNSSSARQRAFEEALRPLFQFAPKDAAGRVDAKAARYALHRVFLQRHGWHVDGIALQGASRKSSRIGEAIDSSGRFSLQHLAHFAATLETLVQLENAARLQKAFDVYHLSREHARRDVDAKLVIEAYMVLFVMSYLNPAHPPEYRDVSAQVHKMYPMWNETKVFAEDIRQTVFEHYSSNDSTSLWDACLAVIEEIGDKYGRWQNRDCQALKDTLITLEETPGTGRVPLSAFWGPRLYDGNWLFTESAPYLQQLGALEGSAAAQRSVIITNYLYSAANCLAGSRYYEVCCINECEALIGKIEASANAAEVAPSALATFVAALPSATVHAPRELPPALLARLHDVAAHHGGVVPLHGRLFAQFLHHAFPYECPYPHHTLAKEAAVRRIQHTDRSSSARPEEVMAVLEAAGNSSGTTFSELPWTDEEELFMHSLQLDELSMFEAAFEASTGVPRFGLLLTVCGSFFVVQTYLSRIVGLRLKVSDKRCRFTPR